jgi:hypothetical protein
MTEMVDMTNIVETLLGNPDTDKPVYRVNIANGTAKDDLLWHLLTSDTHRKPIFIGDYDALWDRLITHPDRNFSVKDNHGGCQCVAGQCRMEPENGVKYDPVTGLFVEHLSLEQAHTKVQEIDRNRLFGAPDRQYIRIIVEDENALLAESTDNTSLYAQLQEAMNVERGSRTLIRLGDFGTNELDYDLFIDGWTGEARTHDGETFTIPHSGATDRNRERVEERREATDDDNEPSFGEKVKEFLTGESPEDEDRDKDATTGATYSDTDTRTVDDTGIGTDTTGTRVTETRVTDTRVPQTGTPSTVTAEPLVEPDPNNNTFREPR